MCAALANRSVTLVLCPDQFQCFHLLPPFPPSPSIRSRCLPSLPSCDLSVITSIHFTLKAASTSHSLTVRNESRASRIFTTDCYPTPSLFPPTSLPALLSRHPPRRPFHNGSLCSPFPNFRDYRLSFGRGEKIYVDTTARDRRKDIKYFRKI